MPPSEDPRSAIAATPPFCHRRAAMSLPSHDTPPDLALRATLAPERMRPDAFFALDAHPTERAWMLHDGSLTDRLARAHGPVRVTPTHEGIGRPSPIEAGLLGTRAGGGWWIREITLAAGDVPRLRARTLVPPDALRLQRRLRGLGATPLGRVLFHRDRLRPEVVRGRRRFARARDGTWLRLTCYAVDGEALLVIERLLPAALIGDAE